MANIADWFRDNISLPFSRGSETHYAGRPELVDRAYAIAEAWERTAPPSGDLYAGRLNRINRKDWKERGKIADDIYEHALTIVETQKDAAEKQKKKNAAAIKSLEADTKVHVAGAHQEVALEVEQKKRALEAAYQQALQEITVRIYPGMDMHETTLQRSADTIHTRHLYDAAQKTMKKEGSVWKQTRQRKALYRNSLRQQKAEYARQEQRSRGSYEKLARLAGEKRDEARKEIKGQKRQAFQLTKLNLRRAWMPLYAQLHILEHHLQAAELGMHEVAQNIKPKIARAIKVGAGKIKGKASHAYAEAKRRHKESRRPPPSISPDPN